MIRIAILGSTRGTSMLPLMQAIHEKHLKASIEIVISNKEDALILERAKLFGLKTQFVDPKNLSRAVYDHQISNILKQHKIDLIILIGYMRILSLEFTAEWKNKIINVHPSLLPAHAGLMNLQVHEAVLAAHEKKSGCTVHYVTEEVDAGPILLQLTCHVLPTDTPEMLKERVQQLEGKALIEAVKILGSDSKVS